MYPMCYRFIQCWKVPRQNLTVGIFVTIWWTAAWIPLTISSSGVEAFWISCSLSWTQRPSDEPVPPRQFMQCYCLLSWRISVLFKLSSDRLTVEPTRPSIHLVLLIPARWPLLALLSSSDATRKRTVSSSNNLCKLSLLHAVYPFIRHLGNGPSVHPTVPYSSLLIFGLDPWKIYYLLILTCDIFAPMRSRNVYKDMINNIVSPIDHVVMYHHNHT
jgi:hypothetical protein